MLQTDKVKKKFLCTSFNKENLLRLKISLKNLRQAKY